MKIMLVSFDVWNTLLDLRGMYVAIGHIIEQNYGIKWEEALEVIDRTHKEAKKLKTCGLLPKDKEIIEASLAILANNLGIDAGGLASAIDTVAKEVDVGKIVVPGAKEVIKHVKESGLKAVALGNVLFWPSSITKEILSKAGILPLLDRTYFADEVGVQKPDREAFHKPLKDFGFTPDEGIHVGDSVTEDFGGAIAAGLSAALITPDVNSWLRVGDKIHFIPSISSFADVVNFYMGIETTD